MGHHTHRARHSGSIYPSQGRWVVALTIPTARGQRRKVSRQSRARFCDALRILSACAPKVASDYADPDEARRQRLAAARELGTHTSGEWWALVRKVGVHCFYCRRKTTVAPPVTRADSLVMDHKVPLSRGGSDGIENIVVACRRCNSEKASMTAVEFIQWRRAQNG